MVVAFLKCPHCNRIQTKGEYCAFDGCQLKTIQEVEELHKANRDRDSTDELNERFAKKIKIDTAESRNLVVMNSCKECVNDLLSQVELNIINETFKKSDAPVTITSVVNNSQVETQASRLQPP